MAVSHIGRETLDRRSEDDHRGPIGGQDRTEQLDQLVSYAEASAPLVDHSLEWAATLSVP
jgi:hypothetical protein